MTMTGIEAVDTSVQKTNLWLKDIMTLLNWESREKAYSVLRAVLMAVRDRLTIDESADFSAQLPLVIRGIYYDGWRPAGVPIKMRTKAEFFARVSEFLRSTDPELNVEAAVRAVIATIKKHVTAGEVSNIKGRMPKKLFDLWEESKEEVASHK